MTYDEHMKVLMQKYHKMRNWRKLLGGCLRYSKPFLANAEALIQGNERVNIAKIDEELQPSDSETDIGSASDSDSVDLASEGFHDYADHAALATNNAHYQQ